MIRHHKTVVVNGRFSLKILSDLAEEIHVAIAQEKLINQDVHNIRGIVSSNIGKIIEDIMNEKPDIS